MTRPRARIRFLDLVVTAVAMALILTPVATSAIGASSYLDEPISVTQSVQNSLGAGRPVTGNFSVDSSGVSTGSLIWEAWATATGGFKLTINTDATPAMADSDKSLSISDYAGLYTSWSVGAGDRRFGFSAKGAQAMSKFKNGTKWRGFNGTTPIEVARRRAGAVGATETEVLLRAEMRSALPSGAKPEAHVVGTVTENL